MTATEGLGQARVEIPGPLRFSNSRRDPDAMAASIARLSSANDIPPEQVASVWGVQKGPQFVEALLRTPTYQGLPEREKEHIRLIADRALLENLLEKMRLTGRTMSVDNKRWNFWNTGYSFV